MNVDGRRAAACRPPGRFRVVASLLATRNTAAEGNSTRAVQWKDLDVITAAPPDRYLAALAKEGNEKAATGDDVRWHVRGRPVLHQPGSKDHCGSGQRLSLRSSCSRHERRHETVDRGCESGRAGTQWKPRGFWKCSVSRTNPRLSL